MITPITIPTSAFDQLKTCVVRKDIEASKQAILYVKICEELVAVATANGIHIADTKLGAIEYTGKYWRICDRRTVTNKLGELAETMGVSPTLAKGFKFREDLAKQFAVSFYRELPLSDPGNVKINLNNATLNVSSGEVAAHDPDDMFMYVLPFDYDPNATCERFLMFLEEVLPDADARLVVQEYVGYLFVFGLKLEKFLTLFGSGANGKSVLLDILSALLGRENITSISLQCICMNNSSYVPMLAGKLANICNDVSNKIEDASVMKRIVSGEPITGRSLYKDPVEIATYAKLLFALNELPMTNDLSKGYWRRQLIIPFTVEIPESKQDKTLAKRIIDNELPGVLNWALEGLRRILKTEAFTECKSAEQQLKRYQAEQDNVAQYVEERELIPSEEGKRVFQDLFADYQTFCRDNGYRPCNKANVKNRLIKQGIDVRPGGANILYVFTERRPTAESEPF